MDTQAHLNKRLTEEEFLELLAQKSSSLLRNKVVSTINRIGKEDRQPPKLKTWKELRESKMEELVELIEGVVYSRSKMTVGAESKAGKTWILMDLAQAMSRGVPWFGLKTKKCRVLYVDFELQEQLTRSRFDMIDRHRKYKDRADDMVIVNLRGYPMNAEEFKAYLLNEIGDEKFDVIFLDPLYKIMAGTDHNAAGQVSVVLGNLEEITRRTGATIIYADHFAKGNASAKKSQDRIAGSGVTARDPDAIVTFTENEIGGALSVEFDLRGFPPKQPFSVARLEKSPLFERRDDIDPSRLAGMPGQKPKYDAKQVLSFLPDEGSAESEEWFAAAKTATGISEVTFNRMRSELKKNGHAINSIIDGKSIWMKTPNGIVFQGGVVVEDEEVTADEDPFE
jgi:AAA domain